MRTTRPRRSSCSTARRRPDPRPYGPRYPCSRGPARRISGDGFVAREFATTETLGATTGSTPPKPCGLSAKRRRRWPPCTGGLLHGDVDPENLRLTSGGSAVLIDLGFAHRPGGKPHLPAGRLRPRHRQDYLTELCDPEPSEDLSSDLSSVSGVMLFEMLTGQPYPSGTLQQTFRRHRCDPPADIRRLAELPNALAVLVERLPIGRRSAAPPRPCSNRQPGDRGAGSAVGVSRRGRRPRQRNPFP